MRIPRVHSIIIFSYECIIRMNSVVYKKIVRFWGTESCLESNEFVIHSPKMSIRFEILIEEIVCHIFLIEESVTCGNHKNNSSLLRRQYFARFLLDYIFNKTVILCSILMDWSNIEIIRTIARPSYFSVISPSISYSRMHMRKNICDSEPIN